MASSIGGAEDVSHLVDVRPLRSSEIDVVSSRLNPARNAATHESRLKLQNDGTLVYLIAWIDEMPVGHGMLLWDGPTGTPKQHITTPCPYVEDLWVRGDLRSRGVGRSYLGRNDYACDFARLSIRGRSRSASKTSVRSASTSGWDLSGRVCRTSLFQEWLRWRAARRNSGAKDANTC